MKGLSLAASVCGGILLLLVPSVILPICEYRGFPAMHCSDTALAEYLIGTLLVVAAAAIFFARKESHLLAIESAALLLCLAAFIAPDLVGYCQSPRMPCHYGTVPALKFLSVAAGLGLLISIVLRIRSLRKKSSSAR